MEKLLFKNAAIVSSSDTQTGDLLAENGVISQIGENLSAPGARVIEAGHMVLLPGGVDPHTHFDLDVGFTRASDDFYTGSMAAACGGTTTVIDHMAFGPAGCALDHQLKVYYGLARDAVIDYGLHGVVQHVDADVLRDMQVLLEQHGVSSFKAYLTYDHALNDKDFLRVLERAQALGIVICVHCENDAIVNDLRARFVREGCTQPRYHPLSRPDEAEAEAVLRALALARAAGGAPICIVHLSSAYALAAARLARKEGQRNIILETCPQYLYLHDDLYGDDREGLKYILSPPLRKPEDSAALLDAIYNEEYDTIGTDHCPFFFATQKQRGKEDFTKCPNGMPGVELRMPLLFSQYLRDGRDLSQMVRLCCTNPAKVFGLGDQKGDIQVGMDADLVLFDPRAEWRVARGDLHENVDYTPYEGMVLQGRPVLTASRSEVIVENGGFVGRKGRGQYLKRGACRP